MTFVEYMVTIKQVNPIGKSEIVETNISEIRMPNIQTEEVKITVAAMRPDCIVFTELAHCSRTMVVKIIEEQRVL